MAGKIDVAPVAFFGHGSPMNTLDRNRYTEAWRAFAATLPRPRAIVVVSAHWYVPGVRVTASLQPRTIHDFNGGFDPALFAFRYPSPGSAFVADRIAELLAPERVERDATWGIDHGAYSVLAHLYPDADVPVVQLALDRTKSPEDHYRLARRLAPLRREGVLIAGSGNVVHNLELANRLRGAAPFSWAERHAERVRAHVAGHAHDRLVGYRDDGDDARLAVPTPDHYLPFLYVLAQRQSDETATIFADGIEGGAISMLSLSFGA